MTSDRLQVVRRRAVRTTSALAGLVLSTALVAACSGDDPEPEAAATPTPTSSGTARDAATLVRANPFTGEAVPDGIPQHRAYLVKIENTDAGAPQSGLGEADLVVEELVEGGLTRIAAFFYSDLPKKVGHVRSTRTTDIALVSPTGGQLVASGGAGKVVSQIRGAGVSFASEDTGNLALTRDPGKSAPYDRLLDLKAHADAQSSPGKAPQPYLPFGAGAPEGKAMPKAFGVRFSPTTTTAWRWTGSRYTRPGSHAPSSDDFKPDTVLVLHTKQADAGYRDPAGNPVPETVLTGNGKAQIMHGGKTFTARWHKKNAKAPFRFTIGSKKPLRLPAGKVFIELVPVGSGGVRTR
ncbi:Protein of unknown function (DUF3048) [Mumia flava]|uniref:DUF3048 family protein n=1 Tax=Mumia flava TaxID=1348852 RepID=A0A2M9AR68_9ACTN|nr:Protein of unknown function (DUF3048) [Mumia flava]